MIQDGHKILIIENEFAIRYLIQNDLQARGFTVFTAKDGRSGITLAQKEQPHLIAINLQLPDADGLLLYESLQTDALLTNIPVVFIADYSEQRDKYDAFEAGAADFIIKPFSAEEFFARISAILRKRAPKPKVKTKIARILALYSPKGGVGTTTLSIQLAKAIAIQYERETMLIDLDLPLGGIAHQLHLYTRDHILRLLSLYHQQMNEPFIRQFAQKQHTNLLILPAPGKFISEELLPDSERLSCLYERLMEHRLTAVVDVGSTLTSLGLATLRRADTIFVITSGKTIANRMLNSFYEEAPRLRIDKNRIFPVVNELNGPGDVSELVRFPVARIPTSDDQNKTTLWLHNQGIRKLVSFAF